MEATFAANRNLDPRIKKIDLGTFADEAQELRSFTVKDPERREAHKCIFIQNDMSTTGGQHKLIIESKPFVGTEDKVSREIKIKNIS